MQPFAARGDQSIPDPTNSLMNPLAFYQIRLSDLSRTGQGACKVMGSRPGAMFSIRSSIKALVLLALAALVAMRAVDLYAQLRLDNSDPLLAFPLTVILPSLLIVLLAAMPAAHSREGILMRIGTMIQLCLIIALPPFALFLTLGLPVVFLVVEIFETRAPRSIHGPLVRLMVRC